MMKKISFTLLTFFLVFSQAWAQKQTVTFNYERSSFNMDQPLPAEEHFYMSGEIIPEVSMVEVVLMPGKDRSDKVLYRNLWKRSSQNSSESFLLPVNYNLRGGSEYDLVINYYRMVTDEEIQEMKVALFQTLDTYVAQSLHLQQRRMRMLRNVPAMMEDMHTLVNTSFSHYRNHNNIRFEGFSDIVQDKLKLVIKQNSGSKQEDQTDSFLSEEINNLIHTEVDRFLDSEFSVLSDSRMINNYPTEKVKSALVLHVGYGGAFINDKVEGLNTASSGMAGITLPLGKQAFAPLLMSNTAIIAGFYFQDFENDLGIRATGPIVGRPLYAGIGYKLYEFIRISGGVTVLQNELDDTPATTNPIVIDDGIYFRPFIGISADISFRAEFFR